MDSLPEKIIERLRATGRCRPDILKISEEFTAVAADVYDSLTAQLIEAGEDHALGILMDVVAVNQIKLDPIVLSKVLKVVKHITDFKYPYRYQDQHAIAPLLEIALDEGILHERKAFACRLAVELTIKFDIPRQPVRKVLWQLLEDARTDHVRLMLTDSEVILEGGKEEKTVFPLFTEKDLMSELPEERPPAVIGDGGTVRRPVEKLGRNEPCRCGSGKKYKKCCFDKDQEVLRDASSYEGVTMSQLRENPSLADDASYIEHLKPYELKKLDPSKMNDDQLLRAFRRADAFGLRDVAFQMLLELKGRSGKDRFAVGHMVDLLHSALRAKDVDIARQLLPHIPEEERFFTSADKLRYELLENPDVFRDLESTCKKAFAGQDAEDDKRKGFKEHWFLELSYAFADIMPALSLAFARAAIVSEPDRDLDNEMLIEEIHKRRIELDLEPWGDPIEDYWDWVLGKADDQYAEKGKDDKIRQLQKELMEARDRSAAALGSLREREQELSRLEKKLNGSKKASQHAVAERAAGPDAAPARTNEKSDAERALEIAALRNKIEGLKQEIGNQQEAKRLLRRELQEANEKASRQDKKQAAAQEPEEAESSAQSVVLPDTIRLPEFTSAFYGSCQNLTADLVKKAMQSAVGLAFRDDAVLKHTLPIERMPGHYRIKIGSHHRVIVRRTQSNRLEILDVIQRKDLETWIRQHAQ